MPKLNPANEYLIVGGAGGVKPPPVFIFPSYFFISPKGFNKAEKFKKK